MGLLYERTCGHCKHLFETVTCGVCEVTDHKVIKTGDDDFAENCDLYENKYGNRLDTIYGKIEQVEKIIEKNQAAKETE